MRAVLAGLVIPVIGLLAWQLGSGHHLLDVEVFSRPTDIATAFAGLMSDGVLISATWQTIKVCLLGLSVAVLFGVLFGAVLGAFRPVDAVTLPTVELLRPIPPLALAPLSVIILGYGPSMEVAIVAFACVWPMLLVTREAIRQVDVRLIEVASALEMSRRKRFVSILLPAIFSRMVMGIRLCSGIALVVAVTVEIVVNPYGLGYLVVEASQSFRPDIMYAQLLWIAIVGWLINAGLRRFELRWQPH